MMWMMGDVDLYSKELYQVASVCVQVMGLELAIDGDLHHLMSFARKTVTWVLHKELLLFVEVEYLLERRLIDKN